MLAGNYVRRCSAEFVGTFALVFVAAGSLAFARTLTDIALAYGLVVAAMVSASGLVSGGHFNPAVTLGYLVTRRIAPVLAVAYWVTQFAAAAASALVLHWVMPKAIENSVHLGVPALGGSIGSGAAVVVETVLTFFLVWVYFATMVDERGAFRQIAGIAVGFTVVVDVLMGGVLTGAAINPARAFGPQLVGDRWAHFWVWYVGPFAGAVIAAAVYELLYLRSSDSDEPHASDAATS